MMGGAGCIQPWLSGHGLTSGVPLLFVKLLSESTPLFHGIEGRYIVAAAGADDHFLPLDQTDVSCNGCDSQKKSPHQRKVLLMRAYFNRFSVPVIRLISKDLVRLCSMADTSRGKHREHLHLLSSSRIEVRWV
jgi:hypothetical protein